MVKYKHKFQYLADDTLDVDAWLCEIKSNYQLADISLLENACAYTKTLTKGMTTFYGKSCLEQGLEIADVILSLNLDQNAAVAGLLFGAIPATLASDENIKKTFGDSISRLITSIRKTELIASLQTAKSGNQVQIDKIRKMLLAMATDIRVVIIKLAERLCFMRGIKSIPSADKKRYAQEIFDLYAPLANRLGIGQIKWELEDLAFRYQKPETYKKIVTFLAEKRDERETRIHHLKSVLNEKLKSAQIEAKLQGRAKHIYSIYNKMNKKDLEQSNIYDHSALRILVPSIEDCYTVLGLINSLYQSVSSEFDDYIAHPKPNGYRSIHLAIIDDEKHFEIQIRTFEMHEEAERGVAAHWIYKEGKKTAANDKTKIDHLRQLLDWHREVSTENMDETPEMPAVDNLVYVITPGGDIMDLDKGATPIDFAYHLHSELGHRCRGAKINGHIVPLNYQLQTGDKVEIHTIPEGAPSRDWLNPEYAFVKTSRARSKIMHWFKQQALTQDIAEGKAIFDKELSRHSIPKTISLIEIARLFSLKTENDLLAGLGRGNIRIGQVIHAVQPKSQEKTETLAPTLSTAKENLKPGTTILGAADLLTRFAKCCKPIPGDPIVGYITQTAGISIHHKKCSNIGSLRNPERFIAIDWNRKETSAFVTDLKILTEDQNKVLHDMTALFVNENIKLLSFNSNTKRDHGKIVILVTIEIFNMEQLKNIQHRIMKLPGVLEVTRVK